MVRHPVDGKTHIRKSTSIFIMHSSIVHRMNFIVTAQPGKYFIDSVEKPVITLQRNEKRCFDQSNPSNQNHPLRFSATSNGTWGDGVEYTNGVRVSGTPGTPNAQVCWTVPKLKNASTTLKNALMNLKNFFTQP